MTSEIDQVPPEPPDLGPRPSPERVLDVAIEYTFPASDPIAIENAYEAARRREERR
jgi:hypothetical protein